MSPALQADSLLAEPLRKFLVWGGTSLQFWVIVSSLAMLTIVSCSFSFLNFFKIVRLIFTLKTGLWKVVLVWILFHLPPPRIFLEGLCQYSGLENSKDCIVHRVAKSQTLLSDFHFHCHSSTTSPCEYSVPSSRGFRVAVTGNVHKTAALLHPQIWHMGQQEPWRKLDSWFINLGWGASLVVSLVAQLIKNPPAMRETSVWSLGWEDSPGEGKGYSSILAWRIPGTVERESDTTERLSLSLFTFTMSCARKKPKGSVFVLLPPYPSSQDEFEPL